VRYIKRHLKNYALSTEEVVAKLGAMARGEIPTKTVVRGDEVQQHYDEQGALENVAKVHGLFIDRHTIERIDGLQVVDADPDEQLMITDNGRDTD
jgi:hypothetical protein